MRSVTLLAALLLAGFTVPLAGCGDDPKPKRQRGVQKSKKKKNKAKRGAATAEVDLSKLPPKLRNIDWTATDDLAASMRETRDPFAPYVEDLINTGPDTENPDSPVTKIESAISDTPVDALQLIAIITGGAVHKAMVTDGRGLGHIVRPGEIVGQEPPMRVVRITRNEILFRALEKLPEEEKLKEVRKVLLSQEELQELLP